LTESSESDSDGLSEQTAERIEDIPTKMRFWERLKIFLSALKHIFTSHHPKCDQYKEHTFHLFGRDWCIGCYVGYPSGIIMLLVGYLTGLFSLLSTKTLWIIGGAMMSTYLLSIIGLTKIRWIKIVSKIPLGVGAAFVIAAFFSYDVPFWVSFLFSLVILQTFIILINVKRAIETRKTCNNCEFKGDHNNCPGMRSVMEKLNKINRKKLV
jgi:hypothetical protein